MYYNFNGKTIKISDKEIENSMKSLGISKEEAIQMWLEDEGYEENAEQIALEKKAKESRITATIHEAKATTKKKTQKERVQKDDPAKENIVNQCADTLKTFCDNVIITNKTKMISFELDGDKYELNLVRKRPPKTDKGA